MKFFFAVFVFGTLLCASVAIEYSQEATAAVVDYFKIVIPKERDTAKILNFLHSYISYRCFDTDYIDLMTAPEFGLYYVATVKLTDKGDAKSLIRKKGQLQVEYLFLDGQVLCLDTGHRVYSNNGFVYHSTSKHLDSTHSDSLRKSYTGIWKTNINSIITRDVHCVLNNKGDVQVAASIVRGSYCDEDMGEYLISAVYMN